MSDPEIEVVVPCRRCGAESAVYYEVTDLGTFTTEEFGLCGGHAPTTTPEEFFRLDEREGQGMSNDDFDGEDEWRVLEGDEIPAHLRPDAPVARCKRCGRETVDIDLFGGEDRMTQPDGGPCGGIFNDPREGQG